VSAEQFLNQQILELRDQRASLMDKLAVAVEALEKIEKHGCCVMHNDESCPGCTAKDALRKLAPPDLDEGSKDAP